MIDNSGGSDAEVKIVYQAGHHTQHDVFVRQGDKWECRDLGTGVYTVLFATGRDWDARTRRFTYDANYFAFGKSLWYGNSGERSTGYEITLYDTPDGTVERQSIEERAFNGT